MCPLGRWRKGSQPCQVSRLLWLTPRQKCLNVLRVYSNRGNICSSSPGCGLRSHQLLHRLKVETAGYALCRQRRPLRMAHIIQISVCTFRPEGSRSPHTIDLSCHASIAKRRVIAIYSLHKSNLYDTVCPPPSDAVLSGHAKSIVEDEMFVWGYSYRKDGVPSTSILPVCLRTELLSDLFLEDWRAGWE